MSDIEHGILTGLSLGHAANRLVEFSGVGSSVQNITRGQTVAVTPRTGGRGLGGVQLGKFVTHDFGVACSSNDTHDPVLADPRAPGGRIFGRYQETPDEAAVTFEAVVQTLTLTLSLANDTATWAAAFAVDGIPTGA